MGDTLIKNRIDRKARKLARRLAESNVWCNKERNKTLATFADVWVEANTLIQLMGYSDEYNKRAAQIAKLAGK